MWQAGRDHGDHKVYDEAQAQTMSQKMLPHTYPFTITPTPAKIAYPLTIEHFQAKINKLTRKTGQDDTYQGEDHGYHKAESVTHLAYVVLMSQKRLPAYHPL